VDNYTPSKSKTQVIAGGASPASVAAGDAPATLVLNGVFASRPKKPANVKESLKYVNGVLTSVSKDDKENKVSPVLKRFALQSVARVLLPKFRVAKCLRVGALGAGGVDLLYSEEVKRAHFAHLQTCGMPWVCPVCAAKISERRRVDLAAGVEYWRGEGGGVFMVTFTLQHGRGDELKKLLRDMNQAYREIKSGRSWQAFISSYGVVGNVSATEITYGQETGFHPHKHVLFFSRRVLTPLEIVQAQIYISGRWSARLDKNDRYASFGVGVKVQAGWSAVSDYVAKWGVTEEITKANTKAGRVSGDRYSPFQLLELYGSEGISWAAMAFIDYAKSTKGLQQLRYTKGLRDLLGLGVDLSDDEIIAIEDKKARLLITFVWRVWGQILRRDIRGQLLEVASTGSLDYVLLFLRVHGVDLDDKYLEYGINNKLYIPRFRFSRFCVESKVIDF
jgi:hypothetical protein